MTKQAWGIFVAAAFGGASMAVAESGDGKWQASHPTKADLEIALKATFEEERARGDGRTTGTKCVPVPTHPAPDGSGKYHEAFAWRMDFIDGQTKDGRQKQLRQLDALAKVGLLDKSAAAIEQSGARMPGVSYALSSKGWGATIDADSLLCFPYGAPTFGA